MNAHRRKSRRCRPVIFSLLILPVLLPSCQEPEAVADAYGNFETTEVIVSAETGGRVVLLDVEEGQTLAAGALTGIIDTTPLVLQKRQLEARIRAIRAKTQSAEPQIAVLDEQIRNLERERRRLQALLEEQAATPKQYDDLNGQLEVLEQQVETAKDQTAILNRGILAEIEPLRAQIAVLDDQIRRCYLYNPIGGVVLTKMAERSEVTAPGKPIYKIARMKEMVLRAYVSGAQLPQVRIGQEVEVIIDADRQSDQTTTGTVTWIASEAEFTPKIVQTKEQRVNLVYAVKVSVPNPEGLLKIGMPGAIKLN